MALEKCPECNEQVSDEADACPNCGKDLNTGCGGGGCFGVLIILIIGIYFLAPGLFIKALGTADKKVGIPVWINAEYNEETLTFTTDQIDQINSEFDSNVEIAWCFETVGNEVTSLRKSTQQVSSNDAVLFRCKGDPDGMMHSHTSLFSLPFMSRTDMGQLTQNSFQVSCVVGGEIKKKDDPVWLNCFRNEGNDEFSRFHIAIDD